MKTLKYQILDKKEKIISFGEYHYRTRFGRNRCYLKIHSTFADMKGTFLKTWEE